MNNVNLALMEEDAPKNDLIRSIYGPFHRILMLTGFFITTKKSTKLYQILSKLPMFIITGLLVARFIYMFIQFKKAEVN